MNELRGVGSRFTNRFQSHIKVKRVNVCAKEKGALLYMHLVLLLENLLTLFITVEMIHHPQKKWLHVALFAILPVMLYSVASH